MAKKVVVYIAQQAIEDLGKSKCYVNATPSTNRSKATVVVSDERVFTESEVKAMASEIVEAAMAECNTVYHTDEDAEAEMSAMIRRILERHGVVLDPA
jgi:MarR-like DNA-binding transcriptional regulator SgrR of sgrS sRNA